MKTHREELLDTIKSRIKLYSETLPEGDDLALVGDLENIMAEITVILQVYSNFVTHWRRCNKGYHRKQLQVTHTSLKKHLLGILNGMLESFGMEEEDTHASENALKLVV